MVIIFDKVFIFFWTFIKQDFLITNDHSCISFYENDADTPRPYPHRSQPNSK